MINEEKWIDSIPNKNKKSYDEIHQLDPTKWTETIPKKNRFSLIKKYSYTSVILIVGLILVSVVKNETRNLQKEINLLQASVNKIEFNFNQAVLDYEIVSSPENIYKLAKENLNFNLVTYEKSQIKNLNDEIKSNEKPLIVEKIAEIEKIREIYYLPKKLPGEVKIKLVKKIEQKKKEIKDIYSSPKEFFTQKKMQRWTVVQVVKLFLGIPVVPGR